MSAAGLDARWLALLRGRAEQPPLRARVPFALAKPQGPGDTLVGSVEPRVMQGLSHLAAGAELAPRAGGGWVLAGEATPALDALAQALRQAGWAHTWRDEQLAVRAVGAVDAELPAAVSHAPLATVERAVVRPLGIATRAVHLVGLAEDGGVWLQQRAWNKANDPGRWDTLMGGMVAACDDLDSALVRETWEEAGLHVAELRGLRHGGWIRTRRPAGDREDAGYVVEDIAWSVATLPTGMEPCNQDGEVERFECVDVAEVVRRLHADAFTDEAALILVEALGVAP